MIGQHAGRGFGHLFLDTSGSHDGHVPVAGVGAAGEKLDGENAGQRDADQAGTHPDDELVAGDVSDPASPFGQRLFVDVEYAADVGEGDAMAADDAGNGADFGTHAPTLVTREVADGRVGEPAVAGDGSQGRDHGDQRQVHFGKPPALEATSKKTFLTSLAGDGYVAES